MVTQSCIDCTSLYSTANLFLEGYIIWPHNTLTFDLQYIHIQQKLKLHLEAVHKLRLQDEVAKVVTK